MRHAIVVFSKVPQVGVTKTRLTEKRGGILTEEESNSFYEAFLADVLHACDGVEADLYLCHNADGDTQYLDKYLNSISMKNKLKIYHDKGGSFDQCMQFASDYILKDGGADRLADSVTIVGGDLPTMQKSSLQESLNKLEKLSLTDTGKASANNRSTASGVGAAIVEGACQEGGFSLIGFTCTTPFNFDGVFYNTDGITALDMIVQKAAQANIPLGIVEMIPDVDIPLDLAGMIPNVMAYELASLTDSNVTCPKYTSKMISESGLVSMALPPQR